MPPRKLTSLRAKAAAAEKEQEADAAQQDRAAAADANDPSPPATDAAHEPQSSSSSSATATRAAVPTVKPRPAFKPNSAVEARAKQTKDVFQSEDGPAPPRERRDPTQRRPRREMPPRPRIEDTMLPSNLTGNIKASGASGSKGGGGGFARAAAGAGAGNITTGFAGADVKLETQHAGSAAATATNFLPFSSDLEAKDLVGTLDERDLFMIADGFGVDDDDAPVSLGWSRKVRDREHFLAGKKAASEVKADSMDLDPDGNAGNELQSFNEFVQPEQKQLFFFQLPRHLPHFDGLEGSLANAANSGGAMDVDDEARTKSEGLIGKILVHKSGKMKMVLGDITLDVDVVPYSDVVQEALAVDGESKTCCILGQVSKRFICTPDINDLLRDFDAPEQ